MTETKIVLTITHKKPLPKDATDVIANRVYGWAYSQGVEVGVNVELTCSFPDCNCPMDPGPHPDWCARSLPHVRRQHG